MNKITKTGPFCIGEVANANNTEELKEYAETSHDSVTTAVLIVVVLRGPIVNRPVAPVVQVVNLEVCLCLSPGFEPQVGRTFDFIFARIKIKRIQLLRAPCSVGWNNSMRVSTREEKAEIFSR